MNNQRAGLSGLLPIEFQPSIVGLDVIETPPEQITLMMSEFRAREAEIARDHHDCMDDMGRVCDRLWATAPAKASPAPASVAALEVQCARNDAGVDVGVAA